jgi:hypothetical protein
LDNSLAEDVVLVYSGTDASYYYQLELSTPNSWINPFHEKLFEYSWCRLPRRHSIRLPHVRQSLHFLEQLLYELTASDLFLDSERLISGLFYDPDDFVFAEIVHGKYNLAASRALFPHRANVRIISTYSEEEYILIDTLELNVAA